MAKKRKKAKQVFDQARILVKGYDGQLILTNDNVRLASPPQRKAMREEFHDTGRDCAYMHLARTQPEALKHMGFSARQTGLIAESGIRHPNIGEYPKRLKHFSWDHIKAIKWEGTNDIGNLCLGKSAVTQVKDNLEMATRDRQKDGSINIKTINPIHINGEYLHFVIPLSSTEKQKFRRMLRDRDPAIVPPPI